MMEVSRRILAFNKGRLPNMLRLKYKFMAENMFRFYRGTCHLYYEDLVKEKKLPAGPLTWICGDMHLENFGSYKGDNRLVYFDLNDFDEAVLAPATWEVSRMACSILLAFEILDIDGDRARKMAALFIRSYAANLAKGKARYVEAQTAKGIVCSFLTAINKRKQARLLKKKTVRVGGELLLRPDNSKHLAIEKYLKRELCGHITQWLLHNSEGPYNYEVADAVFRVAGTGSVGLKRYMFLLKSINDAGAKYLLVDMKQAVTSTLSPYVKAPQPEWETQAQRIVAIQQRMQNVPPALLSTTMFQDECYIIQELQPVKDSIDFKLIKDRYRDIYRVIDDMALLTASAQLRSSGRQGSATADELIAFGNDTEWQKEILDYAARYAKAVKKDYSAYMKDYGKGVYVKQRV